MILAAAILPAASINVYAAASLKDAFTSIARSYERSHKGTKVKLSFAGSQTLAAQIKNGAPADVFASADMKSMFDAGKVGSVQVFARNSLTIVIRKDLRDLTSLKDLGRVGKIVVADRKVPAGKYTATLLAEAGERYGSSWLSKVEGKIVSRELDVRTVLARVRMGEADAGIVYDTDAQSAGRSVQTVPVPSDLNVSASYPVGIPGGAPNPVAATSFLRYLRGDAAQKILRSQGFLAPQRGK